MSFTKINTDDIPEFQKKYIDLVDGDPIEMLANQKESFTEFLEQLDEAKLDYRYAENKWTLREVIVHIIDTEQIFNYRALCVMRGDTQNLAGFDQDVYISNAHVSHYSKEYLINYFTITRYNSLVLIKGANENVWENEGHISDYKMKLKVFPYMLAGHLKYHMQIIKERYLG